MTVSPMASHAGLLRCARGAGPQQGVEQAQTRRRVRGQRLGAELRRLHHLAALAVRLQRDTGARRCCQRRKALSFANKEHGGVAGGERRCLSQTRKRLPRGLTCMIPPYVAAPAGKPSSCIFPSTRLAKSCSARHGSEVIEAIVMPMRKRGAVTTDPR